MNDFLTIRAGDVVATVSPSRGGRLAQLTIADTPLIVGHTADAEATGWGSYPMVPWAGRIRHGRFVFDGTDHQLPINFGPHAIHGVGFSSVWAVDGVHDDHATLRLDLPRDETWPFGGTTIQQFSVDTDGLTLSMTVTADDQPFPVSFGWHPWFRKPEHLDFRPTAMYRRDDDHIALAELVDVPAPPWDDCFVNTAPIAVRIDGIDLELTSNCDHWVVYDERAYATCIEPQTAPPDAFNIAPRRLDPGESLSAWYRISRRG